MTNDIQISEREREILRLVATGATNQQIALQLNISINTVKVHLRNIFGKIGVVSRTEATVYAIRNGLVSATHSDAPEFLLEVDVPQPQILAEPVTTVTPLEVDPASPVDAPRLESEPDLAPVTPVFAVTSPQVTPIDELAEANSVASAPRTIPRSTNLGVLVGTLVLVVVLGLVGFVVWSGRNIAEPSAPVVATDLPGSAGTMQQGSHERWITHAPLPRPRHNLALAAYDVDGRIYAIGGMQDDQPLALLDRYDPQTGLWVSLVDKPTAVTEIDAIVLRGKIYVPGGETVGGAVSNVLEAYNPREQQWEVLSSLPEPRSRYALTVWEGRIYVIGGWNGQRLVEDVFIYDPEQDSWSRGVSLPSGRQHANATTLAGQIYLVGGEGASGPLRDTLRLDPGADNGGRWEGKAPMPIAIAKPGLAAVINTLLVFDDDAQAAWQYNPVADAWSTYTMPEIAFQASDLVLFNTSLFFVAGADASPPGAVGEYRVIFTIFVPSRATEPLLP
ncbi:helix-turn-helix domain-containing protein [Candidatus Chloroploca asiatica]|uniref:HTH luxR-type domain-containing protein n=1 Tax=Candidatus Chloroploca asiatica TaxID=1506545 RepID=A0A2H3L970_9CHLR|nr:helix-turn-helix domain-containing protein [Candidatus Chloroploca asiatica]PDV98856.1 hypothetical protein A9Q02_02680 [Candidatus Chloroploca asiatica]